MLLIDKGNIVALGTTEEMRSSTQPRVRQFLDRIAEPEVSGELDYLQMLTAERPMRIALQEERIVMQSKREQVLVGLFVLIAVGVLFGTVFAMSGAYGRSLQSFIGIKLECCRRGRLRPARVAHDRRQVPASCEGKYA